MGSPARAADRPLPDRLPPVRDVLVDYLRERQPAVDFSTLQRPTYLLGKLSRADLEAHHPGIDSLKLPRDVAAAWKQRVLTRPRTTRTTIRSPGRGWTGAACSPPSGPSISTSPSGRDDPARCGPFAVRCPVSASDV